MGKRRGQAHRRPAVGAILTGIVVGQAKRGVQVEVDGIELLLPRPRYGAAADRIEGASYGTPLTVEVVAEPTAPGGIGLSRIGIERSVRQPRALPGQIRRRGAGFELVPEGEAEPFVVILLDRADPEAFEGRAGTWMVGAPHRGLRMVLVDEG